MALISKEKFIVIEQVLKQLMAAGSPVEAINQLRQLINEQDQKTIDRIILDTDIVEHQVLAMQAAIIDAELVSPEQGMKWIFNTLWGPGNLPDIDEAKELGGAQAWFNLESGDDRRAKTGGVGRIKAD
jgi:hypothetical protein